MRKKRSAKLDTAPVWRCKVCGATHLVTGSKPARCWNRRCRSRKWETGQDKRRL